MRAAEWTIQFRLVRSRGAGYGGGRGGFEDVGFHEYMIVCLNCVPSVAMNGAAFTPSWHPTTVGAVHCAVAVYAASRRWLSFLR